jgi:hypothetical protein
MHKYITLFFSVTLVLSACKGDKTNDKIIKRDQMVTLLAELHIVDGGVYNTVSQDPDSIYKYGMGKYLLLFKRHHVDSAQFRKSLMYYANKPVELSAIYVQVLDVLKQKTDSVNKKLINKNNAQRPIHN